MIDFFLVLADKKKMDSNFTENDFKLMRNGGKDGGKKFEEFFNEVFLLMIKDSILLADPFLKLQKEKVTEEEFYFLIKDIMDNKIDLLEKFID